MFHFNPNLITYGPDIIVVHFQRLCLYYYGYYNQKIKFLNSGYRKKFLFEAESYYVVKVTLNSPFSPWLEILLAQPTSSAGWAEEKKKTGL